MLSTSKHEMEHLVDSCERDAVNTEDQPSLVDVSFPQEKSEKIDILDVNLSQEGSDNNFRREETSQTECSHSVLQHNTPSVFPAPVLSVKVIDNVRIPSFSELEILGGMVVTTATICWKAIYKTQICWWQGQLSHLVMWCQCIC